MFPVQVEFHRDELLVSYAGRTARANGLLGVADLFKDLEINPQAFHAGDSSAIERFASVAGIDPEQARSQTFIAMADDQFAIAGQQVADKHLLRRQFRVCPACLRADIGPELTRETATCAYARTAWSLTAVHSCPIHHLLLVFPPEAGTNFDFSHGWEPWLFELFDGDLDKPTQAEGKYEAFAEAVLNGEDPPRPGYLARLDIGAVGAAAEALGLSSIHGAKWSTTDISAEDGALALDAGFEVLSCGEQAVQSLLDALRFAIGKPQERPPGRYGRLHEWLLRGGGAGAEFAPLQDHLSRHIQETWPLGPKDICFRSKVTVRRFHSILTAAAQYGLRPGQVQDLLNGAGLKGAMPLPEYEQIYEARAVEDVLDRVSSSVSMQTALKLLGLTRSQMATLIEAGFLAYTTPVVDHGPIRALLREQILDTLAIDPDEVLLGERVAGRRLHSVHSLSEQTGLHRKRLRKILVQAGLASDESWDHAAHRLVFPAQVAEGFCRDLVDAVSLHQLAEALDCTRNQAESLYRVGVLKPVVDRDLGQGIHKLAFAQREIRDFIEFLAALPAVTRETPETVSLTIATKRTGRSTGDLLGRIKAGDLAACRQPGQVGLVSLRLIAADLHPLKILVGAALSG